MCMFCKSLFVVLYFFSFGHCVVCSFSIHKFLLPLVYLQALLGSLFVGQLGICFYRDLEYKAIKGVEIIGDITV